MTKNTRQYSIDTAAEGRHVLLPVYPITTSKGGVVRGIIDIVVVLPMSTSWMPMLAHVGSILSCASKAQYASVGAKSLQIDDGL